MTVHRQLEKLDLTDNMISDSGVINSLVPLIEGGLSPPFTQLLFS